MKSNNKLLSDDEISFKEIILKLWKEKFKIFIITLIFSIVGYIYGTLQPKVYQTKISLRDAPDFILLEYEQFLENKPSHYFDKEFRVNLMQIDNLINYVEQNKKLDEFRSNLKTNDIEIREYFRYKLQNIRPNKYILSTPKPLPTKEFFNDYVIYVKQITAKILLENLANIVSNRIDVYDRDIKIAKEIELEDPILKVVINDDKINLPEKNFKCLSSFYHGTKVLSHKKLHLEQLLNQLENLDLTSNFNLIVKQYYKDYLVSKSPLEFAFIFLVISIFFSIILIFIKEILKKQA